VTLKTWFILIPCIIVGVVLTLANLGPVQFSLDPFSDVRPAFAVTVPLIVVIFAAFGLGMVAGSLAAWAGQHRNRAEGRAAKRELKRVQKQQTDTDGLTALPDTRGSATPALPTARSA